MANNKTLFVIDPEHGLQRWDIQRRNMDLNAAIVSSLCAGIVRKVNKVFPMTMVDADDPNIIGNVNIAIGASANDTVFSLPVHQLKLTAPFTADPASGYHYPDFTSRGPIFPMVWQVPENMRLVLAVTIDSHNYDTNQFLVAFNSAGQSFRLPLSNLYNDCRLCHGTYDGMPDGNRITALQLAWQQFKKSQWNSHLWPDSTPVRKQSAAKMFGFKPKNDGFEQMPVPLEWSNCCEKVGNQFIIDYVIP